MNDLQKLAQHREALLLAEVAGWLHDIGKLTAQHLESQLQGGLFSWPNDMCYKIALKRADEIINFSSGIDSLKKPDIVNAIRNQVSPVAADFLPNELVNLLENKELLIHSEIYTLGELITLGTPGFATNPKRDALVAGKDGWLPALLGICHHVAHHDKPELPQLEGIQNYPQVFSSSALGYETLHFNLNDRSNWVKKRDRLIRKLTQNFIGPQKPFAALLKFGLGDTRWPINEILLDDWGLSVAAFFKPAVAKFVMTGTKLNIGTWKSWKNKIIDFDVKWRLLNLRTDGLAFLSNAPSIPDLLARKSLLTDGLNKVQALLETAYPLGLEVYRDESGSLFVVPDIEDIDLRLVDGLRQKNLRELILECFGSGTVKDDWCLRIEGEILPEVTLSNAWDGQAPSGLPPVGRCLQHTPDLQSSVSRVADQWCHNQEQVCSSCGLRQQGPSKKAKQRSVCDTCEQRRDDRSKAWVASLDKSTIWLNEVADVNGRLCLLIGQFDLNHWLSGALVQSLAVRDPIDGSSKTFQTIAKNPSFARLRRIWNTTRQFWQQVLPTEGDLDLRTSLFAEVIGKSDARICIRGKLENENGKPFKPWPYHVYELVLTERIKLSVVWDPSSQRFITAENLRYVYHLMGEKEPARKQSEKNKEYEQRVGATVHRYFKQRLTGRLHIEQPGGYGSRNESAGYIIVSRQEQIEEAEAFIPAIPILAEPRTFMALVPADKALAVVDAIKTKYEREMGKVRNRLPLHLGIVYAHRRTPLRAVLDAGRRMLQQSSDPAGWKVTSVVCKHVDNGDELPPRFKADAAGQFKQWYEISLERNGDALTWYIPAVMGDGRTEDRWYPYVYLNSDTEPSNRQRYFEAPNPWKQEHKWLVHAGELQEEDIIYFTSATLDIQWLDAAGRRFEIAYDDTGKRLHNLTKPYVLDDLENLDRIWETLFNHLSKNQIYAIRDSIETKRDEWQPAEKDCRQNGMFWRFCRDVLANAQWQKGKTPDREGKLPWEADANDKAAWFDEWAQFAANGWLVDVVELRMQIMKERLASEN